MNMIMHTNGGAEENANHACAHAPLIKQALLWIQTPGAVNRNNRVAPLYLKSEKQQCADWTDVTRLLQQLHF